MLDGISAYAQAHGALTHPVEPLSPGMLASLRLPFVTAMPGLHNLDGLAVLDRVPGELIS